MNSTSPKFVLIIGISIPLQTYEVLQQFLKNPQETPWKPYPCLPIFQLIIHKPQFHETASYLMAGIMSYILYYTH